MPGPQYRSLWRNRAAREMSEITNIETHKKRFNKIRPIVDVLLSIPVIASWLKPGGAVVTCGVVGVYGVGKFASVLAGSLVTDYFHAISRKESIDYTLIAYISFFNSLKLRFNDQESNPLELEWLTGFIIGFAIDIVNNYNIITKKPNHREKSSPKTTDLKNKLAEITKDIVSIPYTQSSERHRNCAINICTAIIDCLRTDEPSTLAQTDMFRCLQSQMVKPYSNLPAERLRLFFQAVIDRLEAANGLGYFEGEQDIVSKKSFESAICNLSQDILRNYDQRKKIYNKWHMSTESDNLRKKLNEKNESPKFYAEALCDYMLTKTFGNNNETNGTSNLKNDMSQAIIEELNETFGINKEKIICQFMKAFFSNWGLGNGYLNEIRLHSTQTDIFYFTRETISRYNALKRLIRNTSTQSKKFLKTIRPLIAQDVTQSQQEQNDILEAYKQYFIDNPKSQSAMFRAILLTIEYVYYIDVLARKVFFLKNGLLRALVAQIFENYKPQSDSSKQLRDYFTKPPMDADISEEEMRKYEVEGRRRVYRYLTLRNASDAYPYNYGKITFRRLLIALEQRVCDPEPDRFFLDNPVVEPR